MGARHSGIANYWPRHKLFQIKGAPWGIDYRGDAPVLGIAS